MAIFCELALILCMNNFNPLNLNNKYTQAYQLYLYKQCIYGSYVSHRKQRLFV
jgi:hypothetical protein